MFEWGNKVFEYVSDNLSAARKNGEQMIGDFAGSALKSVQWIWEALQGDFNENPTMGQIAANAVLGVVPIVDQVLDVRDLIANARNINKDSNNKAAWIALGLTLVGLFPSLGSLAKGVLKIILLSARRVGGAAVLKVIDKAMEGIRIFLSNDNVRRIFGIKSFEHGIGQVITKLKEAKGKISKAELLKYYDKTVGAFKTLIGRVKPFAPAAVMQTLESSWTIVNNVRKSADAKLAEALAPVQKAIDDIIVYLEQKIGLRATTNTRTPHPQKGVKGVDPRILTRTEKGLYGEIVSDEFMKGRGYRSVMPEDRVIRNLYDTPRGRGIDGVYLNKKPPPGYVITETKFRTTGPDGKNIYVDRDGVGSDALLTNTRTMGRQMSDTWVEKNLEREFNYLPRERSTKMMSEDISESGYLKILFVVDDSGKVISSSRIDEFGKVIGAYQL